jgi:PAS domain S-box-containing protein
MDGGRGTGLEEILVLRSMIDQAAVGIARVDPDGNCVLVNRTLCELLGYSEAELHKRSFQDLLHPEDQRSVTVHFLKMVSEQAPSYSSDLRCVRRDGAALWTALSITPLRGPSGFVFVFRDISAKKRAEDELRLSETRKGAILSAALDAIVSMDHEGRIIEFNPSAEEIFGCRKSEVMGRMLADVIIPPAMRERHRSGLASYLKSGASPILGERIELAGWRSDGSEFPIELTVIRVPGSTPPVFTGFLRDITERRRAREELEARVRERTAELESANRSLRESQERFETFMDNSPAIAFIRDAEGRYVYVNRTWQRSFRRGEDETIGKTLFDVWPEATARELARNDRRILSEKLAVKVEEALPSPDGSWRTWSMLKFPMQDQSGREFVAGVGIDEEDRRRLEEQLRHAQRIEAVGELAGGVAHDFNNILTAILGYSWFLQEELGPENPGHSEVLEIRKAAERGAALTRQLLAFSRRQVLRPAVLDLNAVIGNLRGMLHRTIGEKIELRTSFESALARVWADVGQIEQVILNLVVNARDAMPEGGTIVLETANVRIEAAQAAESGMIPKGEYATMTVADSGVGMGEETRLKIFQPFFTTKEHGTGLGLSIVYGIVQQSEGHIRVHSTAGGGSKFVIYLPAVAHAEPAAAPRRAPGSLAPGTGTILVAEDEDTVRSLVVETLKTAGYSVLEARDAAEALEISERHSGPIQVLLTDVVMPGINGPDLAERLRPARPEMRVLFMSGYTESGSALAGKPLMEKPFTPEALAERVRELMS